jgi:hypothetical protein
MRVRHKPPPPFARAFLFACAHLLATGSPLAAQERPFQTADPVPLPHGVVSVEIGADLLAGVSFPLSGLSGDLVRVPSGSFRLGVGGIAELQAASGLNLLFVDERGPGPLADQVEERGDFVHDTEDPVVGAKLRLHEETRLGPATGLRVATRLPSAGQASGLGNDTMDFLLWILAGKTIGRTRVLANGGIGILSIPTEPARQNDVLVYGLAVTRPVGTRWLLGAEVHGRRDLKRDTPPGTEDRGQARLGVRWSRGALAAYGAVVAGLHHPDPEAGVVLGLGWTHQAYP